MPRLPSCSAVLLFCVTVAWLPPLMPASCTPCDTSTKYRPDWAGGSELLSKSGRYPKELLEDHIQYRLSSNKVDHACNWSQFEDGSAVAGFQGVLASLGGWPKEATQALMTLDKKESKIVFILALDGGLVFEQMIEEFFCGIIRLGLRSRVVVTVMSERAKKLSQKYGFATIFDKELVRIAEVTGKYNKVNYGNRIMKLLVSLLFVEHGFDTLLSDLDTVWADSPLQYMEDLGADLVGVHDYCWMDMNSGFLFYRANDRTVELLRAALGYIKDTRHCTDNDQYLFNCAWPYFVARRGLDAAFTDDRTQFRSGENCQTQALPLAEAPPMNVLHTSGMTNLQKGCGHGLKIAAMGVLIGNLNRREDGQCLPPRSAQERQELGYKMRYRCTAVWSGGVCSGRCEPQVQHLQSLATHLSHAGCNPREFLETLRIPMPLWDHQAILNTTMEEFSRSILQNTDDLQPTDPVSAAYVSMVSKEGLRTKTASAFRQHYSRQRHEDRSATDTDITGASITPATTSTTDTTSATDTTTRSADNHWVHETRVESTPMEVINRIPGPENMFMWWVPKNMLLWVVPLFFWCSLLLFDAMRVKLIQGVRH